MRKRHQSTRVPGHDYLHLHALPTSGKPRYALSYLPSPPLHEASPTVLGIVNGERVTPAAFEENPEWRPMLHELLKHSVWSDEVLQVQANSRVEGYLHIIGEPELATWSSREKGLISVQTSGICQLSTERASRKTLWRACCVETASCSRGSTKRGMRTGESET